MRSIGLGLLGALVLLGSYSPLEAQLRRASIAAGVAPPTGVTVLAGPGSVSIGWQAGAGVTQYDVMRTVDTTRPPIRLGTVQALSFQDNQIVANTVYYYQVVGVAVSGVRAASGFVRFPPLSRLSPIAATPIVPKATNPTGFSASVTGPGTVQLNWKPVTGAVQYRVDGDNVPSSGLIVSATNATVSGLAAGGHTWQVAAIFSLGIVDMSTRPYATVMVRLQPSHSLPWLTKQSGGLAAAVPLTMQWPGGNLDPWAHNWAWVDFPNAVFDGWVDAITPAPSTTFRDATMLGVIRSVWCWQSAQLPFGPTASTLCVAGSHSPGPGEAGWGDPSAPDQGFTKVSIILQDPSGTRFFARKMGNHLERQFDTWDAGGTSAFDDEGEKNVPSVCMSCHGGVYNSLSKRVVNATLLPFDPDLLSGSIDQESIRKLNAVVYQSVPSAAVKSYVSELYGGGNAVMIPGTQAKTGFVPSGWSSQSGPYLLVIKKDCAMCHLAASPNLSFATVGNFTQNAALIYAAVCVAHSMPHSELQFKDFWTRDTGPVYLPGLLAAVIGKPSCP